MIKDQHKNILAVLIISTALTALYLKDHHQYFLIVAVIISCVSIASPYMAEKINMGWMWLGKVSGYVTNTVILTVLFFLVLVPVALISNKKRRRMFFLGKAPDGSTFLERKHLFEKKDLIDMW